MRQRVASRYFEDVSVMLTINVMVFLFRLILGFGLLYALASYWGTTLLSDAVQTAFGQEVSTHVNALVLGLGLLGTLLIVGLFTRKAAFLALIGHAMGILLLGFAWAHSIPIGNNSGSEMLNPVVVYLPQMIYGLAYMCLAFFLLVVPTYALEFHSLDGKFFSTPTTDDPKDTNE